MSRMPSEKTQLRTAKRMLSELQEKCRSLVTQRDNYQITLVARTREVEEWKRRFDALLKIVPEVKP